MKKYILLKELPFMAADTIFNRICDDDIECCTFAISFHNCVKHYDTIKFSDNDNVTLCSIIDNPEWVTEYVAELPADFSSADAVDQYDAGLCTREQLIHFIEDY